MQEQGVGEGQLAAAVGKCTIAVVLTEVGHPKDYSCAKAFVKAAGLNLKERSSGTRFGRLSITKRGSGRVRQWLFLAVSRWRQKEPLVQAWYEAKVKRDGGYRMKAVVVLMRKLMLGLFHAGRGKRFDSEQLFDRARLGLTAA